MNSLNPQIMLFDPHVGPGTNGRTSKWDNIQCRCLARIGSDAHVDGKYKAEDKRVDAT